MTRDLNWKDLLHRHTIVILPLAAKAKIELPDERRLKSEIKVEFIFTKFVGPSHLWLTQVACLLH